MTLAALETTLRCYLDEERAMREIPTLRMLTTPKARIGERAVALAARMAAELGDRAAVSTADDVSRAGGGSLPLADIDTVVVAVKPASLSVVTLEERLRLGEPTIVARVKEDRLLIDPRTLIDASEEDVVVRRVHEILRGE
jgi:L-seryl-tRNA(Ser) seleniumtransferase